jgi:hypothetical protein
MAVATGVAPAITAVATFAVFATVLAAVAHRSIACPRDSFQG